MESWVYESLEMRLAHVRFENTSFNQKPDTYTPTGCTYCGVAATVLCGRGGNVVKISYTYWKCHSLLASLIVLTEYLGKVHCEIQRCSWIVVWRVKILCTEIFRNCLHSHWHWCSTRLP